MADADIRVRVVPRHLDSHGSHGRAHRTQERGSRVPRGYRGGDGRAALRERRTVVSLRRCVRARGNRQHDHPGCASRADVQRR